MVGRIWGGLVAVVMLVRLAGAQSRATVTPRAGHDGAPSDPVRLRYVVAPTGNEAHYRVREQLVGVELPNDAVGTVNEIAGGIVLDQHGEIVRDSSRIVVTLTNLKSDKTRRDGYVQRRTLEVAKFPTVELVPTELNGIAAKPTSATPVSFDLTGDLTVHGVTRPTTWKVTAHADGADVVGLATTAFTFKDFSLSQPSIPVVLSVNDTIRLEYDFRFTPKP